MLIIKKWGGQTKSWSNGSVIAVLVMAGVLTIVFVALSYFQGERSIIPGRIFKQRHIWTGMGYLFFFCGAFFTTVYYLPIYFQVVSGISASSSGVRNLPLIIALVIFTIFAGGSITKFGHYVPLMIFASVFSTVGTGLLYTLKQGTPSSKWIGYQVVAGIGMGTGIQIPIIVGQALSDPADMSATTALLLVSQTFGGAIFIGAAEATFANTLLNKLPSTAPGVDPKSVLAIGVTQIRSSFSSNLIPGVIQAYLDGVHNVFALAIALAGVSLLFSFGSRWINLLGKATLAGGV